MRAMLLVTLLLATGACDSPTTVGVAEPPCVPAPPGRVCENWAPETHPPDLYTYGETAVLRNPGRQGYDALEFGPTAGPLAALGPVSGLDSAILRMDLALLTSAYVGLRQVCGAPTTPPRCWDVPTWLWTLRWSQGGAWQEARIGWIAHEL